MIHPSDISIGIVSKNRKVLLLRLLKYLICLPGQWQSCQILVADGSEPEQQIDCSVIAQSNQTDTRRMVVISSTGEEYTGRNTLIANCKTQWLLFLDDDCLPSLDMLENFLAALNADKQPSRIGLVCGLTQFFGETPHAFRACYLTPFIYPFRIALSTDSPEWGPTVCAIFNLRAISQSFDSDCPVPVSGTDVDIGIRIAADGMKVLMCSSAKVYHSTETWLSIRQNVRRFFTWGRSEAHLVAKYSNRRIHGNCNWLRAILSEWPGIKSRLSISLLDQLFAFVYLTANALGYFYQVVLSGKPSLLTKRFLFYMCRYMWLGEDFSLETKVPESLAQFLVYGPANDQVAKIMKGD